MSYPVTEIYADSGRLWAGRCMTNTNAKNVNKLILDQSFACRGKTSLTDATLQTPNPD